MLYNHGDIWPDIKTAINKKYVVLSWLDILAEDLDLYPKNLYQKLLPYCNAEFKHFQRIVIFHRDTDYYYTIDSPGFFMRNLYKIMQQLNIPSEYVLLISACPDIDRESQLLASECNIPPVKTIYCPYQWCPPPDQVKNIDLNIKKIKKPYICLNGLQRVHRMYILSLLKEYNLFDSGMISLGPKYYDDSEQIIKENDNKKNSAVVDCPQHLSFCQCDPPTRINERLLLLPDQWKIIEKWSNTLGPMQSPEISGSPNQPESRYSADFLQYALWNVVTETVGDYPHTYMSEKTVKAILTKRPFVVLGGHTPIKHLKKLGFRTFDRWINEDYDNLSTFANRSDNCIGQLKKFCSYTTQELQEIALEMQENLEYNFYHYINVFGKDDLEKFIKFNL